MQQYDTVLKELFFSAGSSLVERLSGSAPSEWLNVELPSTQNPRDLRAQDRGLRSIVVNLLPPLFGFVVCLYIWWSLRDAAKLAGAAWLLIGLLYWAWRTDGFRKTVTMESI